MKNIRRPIFTIITLIIGIVMIVNAYSGVTHSEAFAMILLMIAVTVMRGLVYAKRR